ncbi:MAG: glycosyltransferase family 4 protein [Synechocystis sp.]|nr:glycosyltransferase family 4 protein [Synechocystis sp.]
MKITFILHSHNLSGGNRVISIYADHLQKMGHEVCVVCPERPRLTLVEKIKALTKKTTVKRQDFTFFRNKCLNNILLNHPPPVQDIDVPDGDIVIATWWETAEWVAQFSPSKGKKVYFIQHHETHDQQPKERVIATYSLPLHKITISQWLKDLMNTRYGDPDVHLILNSVDTEQFQSPIRPKNRDATVGMLYNTIPWKGCDISLKAFLIAAEKIPNLQLISFGNGDISPQLPLPSNCQYYKNPPQDKLKEIYAQCNAWLVGSRSEGFGLPILEAMACRTPVIATPVGAAPELLANGGGILTKPEDPVNMAEAIIKLCSFTDDEWLTMSQNAYKTATAYTWNDAAILFEKALYQIIGVTNPLPNL